MGLTIKYFDDLLADEVLDVVVIDNGLFRNRDEREKNIHIN